VKINAIREVAIEQTKIGGDTSKAIALAIIYLGDAIREGTGDIGPAIEKLAVEVRHIPMSIDDIHAQLDATVGS
jgi:hypothetical protein